MVRVLVTGRRRRSDPAVADGPWMSAPPQRLALAEIDRRYGALRLPAPALLQQLRGSVQRRRHSRPSCA